MLKALSRLAASLAGSRPTAAPRPPDEVPGTDEMPIIVAQSAYEAWPDDPHPLVKGVIDYVNILTRQGHYTRAEVPARAMQAFHMDYYLAQVNNGGHSQFVRNTGANMDFTLRDIRAGLQTVDGGDYLMLVDALDVWIESYPDEAARQTGFVGGIAPEMTNLDKMFYGLEKGSSLREMIAGMIADAPELMVVPDHRLDEARDRVCAANPLRPLRERIFTILNYDAQIGDRFHGAVGLAAGQALPVAPVVKIGNGTLRRIDGAKKMVFLVTTTEGRRWGVLDDAGLAIHAVQTHDVPYPGGPAGGATRTETGIGDRLSAVTHDQVKAVAALAHRLKAGATVDLLLSRLFEPPKVDRITIRHAGPDADGIDGMILLLALHGGARTMKVVVTEARAVLLHEPGGAEVARVERKQIGAHAAEYAAERLLEGAR